jgi:UDP-2,3-diacylglucosamine hydrolase
MPSYFLLGDLFDFWFEYKSVVPKDLFGFRKTVEIRDSGIPFIFRGGNHDLWMEDYFEKELNIPVFHDNQEYTLVINF